MNFAQKTVATLLALFPCALAGVLGLMALCVGWEWVWPDHGEAFYFNPPIRLSLEIGIVCAFILFFLTCAVGVIKKFSHQTPQRALGVGIVIVLVLMLLRWMPFSLFSADIVPYSDFRWAWQRAVGMPIDIPGLNHRWWPAWMNYSLFLKGTASVVGGEYQQSVLFGMIFDSVTTIGIYWLLRALAMPIVVRFLGVILYVANPSAIVYGLTPTPEHMAVACFMWAMVLFIASVRDRPALQKLFLTLAGGLLAGIGESVKPLLLIIGCALCLGLIASSMKSRGRVVLQVVLFVVVAKLTAFAVTQVSARTFDVELHESTAYPYYLNVGLNRQGEGQIHIGKLSRQYIADLNRGTSLEQARANIVTRLKEDWNGHVSEIPSFIIRKMIWAWQGDLVPFKYFAMSVTPDEKWSAKKREIYRLICDELPSVAQVWYIAAMFVLAGLMVLSVFLKGRLCYGEVALTLICLGFFALVLVGEAQSRYKCLVLPYVCILLANRTGSMMENRVRQ